MSQEYFCDLQELHELVKININFVLKAFKICVNIPLT